MLLKLNRMAQGDTYRGTSNSTLRILTEVNGEYYKYLQKGSSKQCRNRVSAFETGYKEKRLVDYTPKSWAVKITEDTPEAIVKDIARWRGHGDNTNRIMDCVVGIGGNDCHKGHNPVKYKDDNNRFYNAIFSHHDFYRLSGTEPSSVDIKFDVKNIDFNDANYFVYNTKSQKARFIKYYAERQNVLICHTSNYNAEGLKDGRLLIYKFPANLTGFEFKNNNGNTKVLYAVRPTQIGYGDRGAQLKWHEYRSISDFFHKLHSGFYTSDTIVPINKSINNSNIQNYEQTTRNPEESEQRISEGKAVRVPGKTYKTSSGVRLTGNPVRVGKIRGKTRESIIISRSISI